MIACKDCKFYRPDKPKEDLKEGEPQTGACRRLPPFGSLMPGPRGPISLGIWPPVPPEGWCGEFEEGTAAVSTPTKEERGRVITL